IRFGGTSFSDGNVIGARSLPYEYAGSTAVFSGISKSIPPVRRQSVAVAAPSKSSSSSSSSASFAFATGAFGAFLSAVSVSGSSSSERTPLPKPYMAAASSGEGSGKSGSGFGSAFAAISITGGGGGSGGVSRALASSAATFGFFSSADITMAISGSGGTKGFFKTPSAPTRRASFSSNGSNAPTRRITGTCEKRESFFTNSQTSYPLRTGMKTSASIRSGFASARRRTAASPLPTATTSMPRSSNANTTIFWMLVLSSAIIILGTGIPSRRPLKRHADP